MTESETRAEATFDIGSTPEDAWKALEQLRARTAEPNEWWLPGFECRAAEVEVEQPTATDGPQARSAVRRHHHRHHLRAHRHRDTHQSRAVRLRRSVRAHGG